MLFIGFVIFIVLTFGHQHHYHYSNDPPPPTQDECKPVNEREPLECPQHIGPPCPPCYTYYNDGNKPIYNNADSLLFNSTQKSQIESWMNYYINYWAEVYPPSLTVEGYDNFLGSSGRGIIHLRLYNYTKNETYLNIANEYVTHALGLLPSKPSSGSYMYGNIGVWTIKAIIEDIQGNSNEMNTYLGYITKQFSNINTAIINGESKSSDGIDLTDCSLNTGIAGMLYNGLLLNSYFMKDIIDPYYISNLTFYIINVGIQTGESLNTNYLQWTTFIKGCYLWGPGHGSAGEVHTLFIAYHMYPTLLADLFSNQKYYNALKNTLDFYVSIILPDGNVPTNVAGTCSQHYGTDPDARVQWCHGFVLNIQYSLIYLYYYTYIYRAPGFMTVFLEGALYFQNYNGTAAESYLTAALRTSNSTYDRGLLVKGTMFCHGIGGNINMFVYFYDLLGKLQETKNTDTFKDYDLPFLQKQSAFRAKQFILWTLNKDNIDSTRINDTNENYSMYQGNHAIPMIYIQALQDNWPNIRPGQPGWNFVI